MMESSIGEGFLWILKGEGSIDRCRRGDSLLLFFCGNSLGGGWKVLVRL